MAPANGVPLQGATDVHPRLFNNGYLAPPTANKAPIRVAWPAENIFIHASST